MSEEVQKFVDVFLRLMVFKASGRHSGKELEREGWDCQAPGCFGGQTEHFEFGARTFKSFLCFFFKKVMYTLVLRKLGADSRFQARVNKRRLEQGHELGRNHGGPGVM